MEKEICGSGMQELIKKITENRKKNSLFLLCGLLVAFCEVLGLLLTGLEDEGKAYLTRGRNLLWLAVVGIVSVVLVTMALYLVWYGGKRFVRAKKESSRILSRPVFYWGAMLLGWLPCYLAYFPAIYSYDGEPQLIQYTQHAFDNHHPLAHTLFLGACYDAGQFLQQRLQVPLDGMAIYAFSQMVLLSGAFACGFAFLLRRNAPRRMLIATLLWCILFPVNPLMAVSTTKDTFFTAFFLMDFFLLVQMTECGDKPGKKEMICLTIVNLGMMLFRKNGVYIIMGLLIIFAIVTLCQLKEKRRREFWGRMAAVTLLSLILFRAAEHSLIYLTDALPGEAAEALSIPLQQLARTYKSNGEQIKEEDLELLTAYLPTKGMENYRPYVSDSVKMYFNNDLFRENPAGFIRIYLRLAVRYPGSYLMAPAYLTMGDWFLTDISHCQIYQGWWRDRTGYMITDVTPVFALGYMKKENLLPAVRNAYEAIATDFVHQRFLPAKILFAPAFYCFLTLFAGLAFLRQKRYRQLIPWTAVMIYFMTMAAGPCVLIRYIYPFMALMPFLAFHVLRRIYIS